MFNFTSTSARSSVATSPSVLLPTPSVGVATTSTDSSLTLDAPAADGDTLVKEATRNTPYVYFDKSNGLLRIVGRSSPESSLGFYEPILTGLNEVTGEISVDFELIYFNTSSTKCIFSMLKILEDLYRNGTNVSVTWSYEEDDDDMLEVGEDFQDMLDIPLTLVEI